MIDDCDIHLTVAVVAWIRSTEPTSPLSWLGREDVRMHWRDLRWSLLARRRLMHHEHDDLCEKSNCVNRFVLFLRRILRVVNKAQVDFFCQK